jgi:hypothetical protein
MLQYFCLRTCRGLGFATARMHSLTSHPLGDNSCSDLLIHVHYPEILTQAIQLQALSFRGNHSLERQFAFGGRALHLMSVLASSDAAA